VNHRLLAWAGRKEKNMEDLFPRIDPAIVRWNQLIVEVPESSVVWLEDRIVGFAARSVKSVQSADRLVFAEKFPGRILACGSAFSRRIRFMSSGNIRLYFFFGTLITLLAAALFLRGGE
jgi:hypothetical protein